MDLRRTLPGHLKANRLTKTEHVTIMITISDDVCDTFIIDSHSIRYNYTLLS